MSHKVIKICFLKELSLFFIFWAIIPRSDILTFLQGVESPVSFSFVGHLHLSTPHSNYFSVLLDFVIFTTLIHHKIKNTVNISNIQYSSPYNMEMETKLEKLQYSAKLKAEICNVSQLHWNYFHISGAYIRCLLKQKCYIYYGWRCPQSCAPIK